MRALAARVHSYARVYIYTCVYVCIQFSTGATRFFASLLYYYADVLRGAAVATALDYLAGDWRPSVRPSVRSKYYLYIYTHTYIYIYFFMYVRVYYIYTRACVCV